MLLSPPLLFPAVLADQLDQPPGGGLFAERAMHNRGLSENAGEEAVIRERLQRTIDILCEDAARVELWACALNGFAQAVPDYSDPFANPVGSKNETVDKDAERTKESAEPGATPIC
jgi:hypothetical protein